MKITEIEKYEVAMEQQDWNTYAIMHFYGSCQAKRTILVVHTDTGLEGLGEGNVKDEVLERYIGTSPFDWVGDDTSLALGKAMYDLMGKHLGVPAYKLFGQRLRSWVPMVCYTVPQSPEAMAEEVRQASAMGYTWLKFHLSPTQNVIEETEAMQKAAPPGFKIQYDFNGSYGTDHALSIIMELGRFPIAGVIEDPLKQDDLDAYQALRNKSPLPILLHGASYGHTQELLAGAVDGYVLGHSTIGEQMQKAQLLAAFKKPFSIQNSGGAITQSFLAQMSCTFPTATLSQLTSSWLWKSDVVRERFEIVGGLMRVPEGPGLGVTLDRDELERLKALPIPKQPPFIVRSKYAYGGTLHFIHDPEKNHNGLFYPDLTTVPRMGYAEPVKTDFWDDDGSKEYREMFARCQKEPVWE